MELREVRMDRSSLRLLVRKGAGAGEGGGKRARTDGGRVIIRISLRCRQCHSASAAIPSLRMNTCRL